MKIYWVLFVVGAGFPALSAAQQTPPIQPKTVDTPKLQPLELSGPPKPDQQIANAPLSSLEAVRIALAHQPQVQIAKAAADAAHGQTLQAQSALNPTLGASASVTKNQNFTGGNGSSNAGGFQSTSMASGLTMNQLIFDFNRTRDQVRQAESLERAALRNYDQSLQDIVLQVKQDYYSYLQAKQQIKVDTANVASRQSQVNLTQAQLNAGLGAPADLVNAKTVLSQATLQLLQANQAAISASVVLAQEMGIDPRTPINLAEVPEESAPVAESNALVDLALKQRPEILAAQETLRAAGFGVSVARKTDVPSIDLGAGVSSKGTNNPFDNQTGYVSLTLNWSLIDGGLKAGRVRSAEAQRSSAAAQLLQTSQSIIADVSKASIAVKASEQQIQIANAEVGNAQEGVRLAEGRYKAGVTTFQEVITAQAALVTAQTDQVNAVAALSIARASLDHAIGQVIP